MLTPSDPDPHFRLGVTLAEQSKCAEALECFERVIRMDASHAEAYAMAARELAHFKREAEAKLMLESVQALNPSLLEEWEELAALWNTLRSRGA
jgi:tetratricopeptide (TPR) repeat protein